MNQFSDKHNHQDFVLISISGMTQYIFPKIYIWQTLKQYLLKQISKKQTEVYLLQFIYHFKE